MAISVIIALSLLYFIAPMDDIMRIFDKPQNVGEIAGTGITYEDFQAEVNRFTDFHRSSLAHSFFFFSFIIKNFFFRYLFKFQLVYK